MALIVSKIGTAGAGRDYSTIGAWVAAIPADLVAAGNSYEGDCYNDSEFLITVPIAFPAYTCGPSNKITLTAGPGQSYIDHANVRNNPLQYNQANGVGIKTTVNYTAIITHNAAAIVYFTLSRLQMYNAAVGHNSDVYTELNLHNDGCTYQNLIMQSATSGTMMECGGAGSVVSNVLFRQIYAAGSAFKCISDAPLVVGCTAVRDANQAANGTGYDKGNYGGAAVIESCASFGFTTALATGLSSSSKNNATDLSSLNVGTGQTSIPYTVSTPFIDGAGAFIGNADLRPKTFSALQGNGFLESSFAPTDITGTARTSTPTVGAWQFVASTRVSLQGVLNAANTTSPSSAINTLGANLLIAWVWNGTGAFSQPPTDSKGNTWTVLTKYASFQSAFFYVLNPITDATHTFTPGVDQYDIIAAFAVGSTPVYDPGSDQGLIMSTTPQSLPAFTTSAIGDLVLTGIHESTGATSGFNETPANDQPGKLAFEQALETASGGNYRALWWGEYSATALMTITWRVFTQYGTIASAAFKGAPPPPPDLTALSIHFPRTSRPRPFVPGLIR